MTVVDAQALLELKEIDLAFGESSVLKSLSFSVRKGEICSLIGPNGAGKSSVINIINGLYQPQRGKIIFPVKCCRGIRQHKHHI
jgi:branched-chain amino acid transport system ATP-binding protein